MNYQKHGMLGMLNTYSRLKTFGHSAIWTFCDIVTLVHSCDKVVGCTIEAQSHEYGTVYLYFW